jgi:hypothetical protein
LVLRPNNAFFDGSGKLSDGVMTVGGYLASDQACEAIERDWKAVTGGKVFHLADFGTEYCELGSNDWSKGERRDFLKKLGGIVNHNGAYVISASVELSQYAAFVGAASYSAVFGPAYSALAQLCTHVVERTLFVENRLDEAVAYVFEKGDRQHEIAQTIGDYERRFKVESDLRSLHFLPKRTTFLQPSDLIAGTAQHVFARAMKALGSLDNGMNFTRLDTFDRYFSKDGVTASVIPPYNGRILRFVANRPLFSNLDAITVDLGLRKPEVIRKRLKQSRNQGKRSR